MTDGQAVVGGRVVRWVLLACTLFGLAAMHTLGHAGMRMDASHGLGGPAAAVMEVSGNVTTTLTAVMDDCPGCAHATGTHTPDGDGMPGWTVCLAVLTGAAVVVLLAALLLDGSRLDRSLAFATGTRPEVPRGPPRPVGLTLAAVSVLRI